MVRQLWLTVAAAAVAAAAGCASMERDEALFDAIEHTTMFTPPPMPTPTETRLATGEPGPAYWQNRADYRIDARFDPRARRVEASETITYTNLSPYAISYIWLNLEQNLFHPDSRGARLTPPGARFGNRDGFVGGYAIDDVRVDGEPAQLHVHDTLGRIDLDRPLAPKGGRVEISLRFAFDIPEYGSDRLGIEEVEQGTIFQIAQWFPAVAKFDDVHGWNTLPYLGQGEFYTDFGSFDVSITAPREFLVVATGTLQNASEVLTQEQLERLDRAKSSATTVDIIAPEEVGDASTWPAGDGPRTWRFHADDVRTFAWAASDAFVWDAAFLEDSGPGGAGTLVMSVYPREGMPLWRKSTEMLRFSIEHYNTMWFRYPYPTAINVNGIVGGMEYPMIIFCRARDDEQALYGVTTHEIGHNWFPMVVSNNERLHAWMDEGFNTFINYYSTKAWFGEPQARRGDAQAIAPMMARFREQPIETPADQVRPDRLGFLEYAKTAAGLVLLREQILGEERFDRAFREYVRRWAFKSPEPADFFRTMEDVAGEDLSWFWRGWFYSTGVLDQAVKQVRQVADEEGRRYAEVTFLNKGELVMPVVYRLTYDDGTHETRRLPVEAWFNTDRWTTRVRLEPGRSLAGVLIDPEKKFPDVDRRNNAWGRP